MDFIYSRLNNNLVDINRLESITLLKCEQENIPLEGLNIGDYYLKFTVVDSDKINYCDLSQLNDDEKSAADALYEEQQRAIARENTIENNSGNYLDIEQEENTGIVTIKLLNIHGSVLDTKTLDLETEKIIRKITLDQENKSLIFSLVDSTTITCDISDLINRCPIKDDLMCVEMEGFGLMHIAAYCNKQASMLATIVDSKYQPDVIVSPEDRETSLNTMITLALESIIK